MYDEEKSYYLVNPSGAIHQVPDTIARDRLRVAGWRMATKEEISKLFKANGRQVSGKPLCAPWSPVPPEKQELPDQPVKKVVKKGK